MFKEKHKIVDAFERRGLTKYSLEAAIGKKIEELSANEINALREVYRQFLMGKNILEASSPLFVQISDYQ